MAAVTYELIKKTDRDESAQRPRQHASWTDRDAGVHAGGDSRHRQSDEAGRSA